MNFNFQNDNKSPMLAILVLFLSFYNRPFGLLVSGLDAFKTSVKFASFSNNNVTEADLDTQENAVLSRKLTHGVVPAILNPGGATTCICVPPGSCPSPIPSDGSGLIDIRIVNNPNHARPHTCNYGLSVCCQVGPYQCGMRYPSPPQSIPALPGQAAFGAYPWQVALLTIDGDYIGSGALIDRQHVLTAAHKVYNRSKNDFKVRLGEWDAIGMEEPIPAQDVKIIHVFTHNDFNKENLHNDVAILRLAKDIDLTETSTIGTVCLPATPFVRQRCFVAGWGKNDFGAHGKYQAIQREVDVPLVTNAECEAALRRTRLGPGFILNDASFLCAGGELGKDACTGDGGSPLVCQNNGRWFVVGLVAWGIGCAAAGVPGVYVNVATYLPWIQSKLAEC